jgi:hypothetical protein
MDSSRFYRSFSDSLGNDPQQCGNGNKKVFVSAPANNEPIAKIFGHRFFFFLDGREKWNCQENGFLDI